MGHSSEQGWLLSSALAQGALPRCAELLCLTQLCTHSKGTSVQRIHSFYKHYLLLMPIQVQETCFCLQGNSEASCINVWKSRKSLSALPNPVPSPDPPWPELEEQQWFQPWLSLLFELLPHDSYCILGGTKNHCHPSLKIQYSSVFPVELSPKQPMLDPNLLLFWAELKFLGC